MHLLTNFKFAGISISGALGILGTLTETRDKTTGALSTWGKWAFGLTVSGLIVALAAQVGESASSFAEHNKAELASRRQAFAQTQALAFLKLITYNSTAPPLRAECLTKIEPVQLKSEFRWMLNLPTLNVPFFEDIKGFPGVFANADTCMKSGTNVRLFEVKIQPDSPFYPLNAEDGIFTEFLRRLSVWVEIWKPTNSVELKTHNVMASGTFTPTPTTNCDLLLNSTAIPNPSEISLRLDTSLARMVSDMAFPVALHPSQTKTVALENLANAQIVIYVTILPEKLNKNLLKGVTKLLEQTRLVPDRLVITVNGYRIPLSGLPYYKSPSSADDEGFHYFLFPDLKTLTAIAKPDTEVIMYDLRAR